MLIMSNNNKSLVFIKRRKNWIGNRSGILMTLRFMPIKKKWAARMWWQGSHMWFYRNKEIQFDNPFDAACFLFTERPNL